EGQHRRHGVEPKDLRPLVRAEADPPKDTETNPENETALPNHDTLLHLEGEHGGPVERALPGPALRRRVAVVGRVERVRAAHRLALQSDPRLQRAVARSAHAETMLTPELLLPRPEAAKSKRPGARDGRGQAVLRPHPLRRQPPPC